MPDSVKTDSSSKSKPFKPEFCNSITAIIICILIAGLNGFLCYQKMLQMNYYKRIFKSKHVYILDDNCFIAEEKFKSGIILEAVFYTVYSIADFTVGLFLVFLAQSQQGKKINRNVAFQLWVVIHALLTLTLSLHVILHGVLRGVFYVDEIIGVVIIILKIFTLGYVTCRFKIFRGGIPPPILATKGIPPSNPKTEIEEEPAGCNRSTILPAKTLEFLTPEGESQRPKIFILSEEDSMRSIDVSGYLLPVDHNKCSDDSAQE